MSLNVGAETGQLQGSQQQPPFIQVFIPSEALGREAVLAAGIDHVGGTG